MAKEKPRILVLNLPPRIMREECCVGFNRSKTKFPALLSQVTTVLSNEVDVVFFDANAEGVSNTSVLKSLLVAKKPKFVICSVTHKYIDLECAIFKICSELNINCIVIPLPFEYAEEFVTKYDVYFAVYSEPEKTLLDWCRGTSLAELEGIVYRVDSKIIKNPPQEPYFDEIPPINWKKFKVKRYNQFVYQIARGCPYGCVFCSWASKRFQLKRVETVLTDLKKLDGYGVKLVYLLCSQITTNKKWLYRFCEEKIKRRIKILWTTDVRANELTRDAARRMREAGCIRVFMGVESVNKRLLNSLNKKLTTNQIMNALKICNAEGIMVHIPFLFNVGESIRQVHEYLNFIDQPQVSYAAVGASTLQVHPGTKLYEEGYNPPNIGLAEMFRKELKRRFVRRRLSRIWWLLRNKNARQNLISVFRTMNIDCVRNYLIIMFLN